MSKGARELMGYFNKILKCEESFEKSDMEVNIGFISNDLTYFKQTEKWQKAYHAVKSIIDNRELVKNWKTL